MSEPGSGPPPTTRSGRLVGLWTDGFGRFSVRCLQVLLVTTLAVAVIYAALQLRLVVIPVLIALILASAFDPLVRLLVRLHVPNGLAALATLVLSVLVLAGVGTGVALAVVAQWKSLVSATSDGVDQLQQFAASSGFPVNDAQFQQAKQSVVQFVTSSSFASGALAGLSTATSLITGLVLLVFVLFFFLKDGRTIWRFLLQPFHGDARARAERIGARSVGVLGAYVRGTALVALVDAVFIGAGLLILRVPLAVPLTVLVFVTAFIPVVGATVAGIVAALVALVTGGPVVALIVVGIVILVNQLEGNLLQPLIMGKSLSLHPLAILLALTAGTVLGGVIGAVLAVPAASVVWTAIKSWRD
ncbi:AI-2E family transporter [Amnibacterium sp.]|uniref:AI-2E family transporter n=1 Tax=Amnibacterium sp. TaxID=1872496 RepID=UPI00261E7678|nr:AI-2E family transporter [Amnibacterium sp.]MCU1473502.1 hypothetical protein [Amnibacterium sp.]